jgi:hypothetical protein
VATQPPPSSGGGGDLDSGVLLGLAAIAGRRLRRLAYAG